MPRYAYQKPRARVYSYNFSYMNNYYKPMTHYLSKDGRAPSEQPGHQSLAERLKKFPMDGSVYRDRASSAPPSAKVPEEDVKSKAAEPPSFSSQLAILDSAPSKSSPFSPTVKEEVPESREYQPIWMKHPYRLPVEDIHVPPHESSIWPESVPHFNLVSSYDCMIKYLGIKKPTFTYV